MFGRECLGAGDEAGSRGAGLEGACLYHNGLKTGLSFAQITSQRQPYTLDLAIKQDKNAAPSGALRDQDGPSPPELRHAHALEEEGSSRSPNAPRSPTAALLHKSPSTRCEIRPAFN